MKRPNYALVNVFVIDPDLKRVLRIVRAHIRVDREAETYRAKGRTKLIISGHIKKPIHKLADALRKVDGILRFDVSKWNNPWH